MKIGRALAPWFAVAGLACRAAAPEQPAPEPPPQPPPCSWHVPDPIPAQVIRRAVELQARGEPLGTEYVEQVNGTTYRFTRAMHPPSASNPEWHPGIDAKECVRSVSLDAGTEARPAPASRRAAHEDSR
jgi:hypothetical protein